MADALDVAFLATPAELVTWVTDGIAAADAHAVRVTAAATGQDDRLESFDEAARILRDLECVTGMLVHVHPDPDLRAAAVDASRRARDARSRFSRAPAIQRALRGVDPSAYDDETRQWIGRAIAYARRAGVDADVDVAPELSRLSTRAGELEERFLDTIAAATARIEAGPIGTVAVPSDEATEVLTTCEDPVARRSVWLAERSIGHPANQATFEELRAVRVEHARMLGYTSWADYAVDGSMLGSVEAVRAFLGALDQATAAGAAAEYARISAENNGQANGWDVPYVVGRIREPTTGPDLTRAFEFAGLRERLLAFVADAFGLVFTPVDVPVWHETVTAYDVYDVYDKDAPVGRVYFDLIARHGKPDLESTISLATGKAGVQLPACALLAGFAAGQPHFLSLEEVGVLLHELGHVLHILCAGQGRWAANSGIRTESDFIETPGLVLGRLTTHPFVLRSLAVDYSTGAALTSSQTDHCAPRYRFGDLLKAREQLFYAALSLDLHDGSETSSETVECATAERFAAYLGGPDPYIHLSFEHLAVYSATYYTYLWSDVIAAAVAAEFGSDADAFRAAARRFRRRILAPGGARSAHNLVLDFLGHEPTIDGWATQLAGQDRDAELAGQVDDARGVDGLVTGS